MRVKPVQPRAASNNWQLGAGPSIKDAGQLADKRGAAKALHLEEALLETLIRMREERKATRAGRRDGKRGIPGKTEAHAMPFGLLAIKERGDQALWKLAQAWALEDQILKAQFLTCKRTLIDYESRLHTLKDEYGRRQLERAQQGATDAPELETLERLWRSQDLERGVAPADQLTAYSSTAQTGSQGPAEPMAGRNDSSSGTEQVDDASRQRSKHRVDEASRNNVAPVSRKMGIGSLPYWTILALVVVGEIPLNAFAFKLFDEPDLFSYIMTASVALILIACAHSLGIFLSREGSTGAERVLTWILVIVPVLGIGAIATVRNAYLETKSANDLSTLQVPLTFGLLNILIYAGAVVLSYLKHDQQTEYNLKRTRRRLEREQEREARMHRKRQNEELKRLRKVDEAARETKRAEHEQARQQRQRQREEEEAQLARKEQTRRQQEEEVRRNEQEKRRRAEEPLRKRAEQRSRFSREEERALDSLAGQIADTGLELESSRTARQKRWEATCAGAMHRKNYFTRLMLLYCSGNVAARENHVAPPVLHTLPEIEVPPVFANQLEWEVAPGQGTLEPHELRR